MQIAGAMIIVVTLLMIIMVLRAITGNKEN